MKNKFTMMDCVDLVTHQVGLEHCGEAIKFIDKNFDDAWTNHINDIEKMINDPRYCRDQDYVLEVSTLHYNTLREFIKKFKAGTVDPAKQFDLFFTK